MQSKKSVGIVGATLAALSATIGGGENVLVDESSHIKPEPKVKTKRGRPTGHRLKSGKMAPSKAAIKKMTPNKAAYWKRRIADDAMPSWWHKPRNVQARAALVKPVDPVPLTRQVRRARERKQYSQPIRMSAAEWNDSLARERREARLESA